MPELPSAVARLWRTYGAKLIRYSWVSVVSTSISVCLLLVFRDGLGWSFVAANIAAVTISTVPAYILSRRWVWSQDGKNSVRYEIAPFWAMAFLGLALSTLFVYIAEQFTEHSLALILANGAAFGLLWIAKFLVLDKLMWANQPAVAEAASR